MTEQPAIARRSFMEFYRGEYVADHRHPANIAAHMAGTVAGLAVLGASATVITPWWALSFPVVHAVPGLIGHRFFDRNVERGDLRVLTGKTPNWWFMIANHLMTFAVLTGRYPPRR